VNLARGTLTVTAGKTDAATRVVDLSPALRDELAEWRTGTKYRAATDLVFPTHKGEPDNRQNVRRRLLIAATKKANPKLAEQKLEPIGAATLHGLRRLFATLRVVSGDDPVYVASQLGHTDPAFSLRVYAQAVKHRQRLTPAERKAYDEALLWAQLGTNPVETAPEPLVAAMLDHEKTPPERGFREVGATGLEPVTPSLSSWCSPN